VNDLSSYILLLPPVAFVLFLLLSTGFSALVRLIGAKGTAAAGKEKSYACGQEIKDNKAQPNYAEFFPFAFFFTIMHVVVLIIATAPGTALWMAIAYVAVALMSLLILFRR
jgi:NADH:ubiquinone oxidoreductase subunit 3 (subunit A)